MNWPSPHDKPTYPGSLSRDLGSAPYDQYTREASSQRACRRGLSTVRSSGRLAVALHRCDSVLIACVLTIDYRYHSAHTHTHHNVLSHPEMRILQEQHPPTAAVVASQQNNVGYMTACSCIFHCSLLPLPQTCL